MPVTAMLIHGGSIVVVEAFNTEAFWPTVRKTGITTVVLLGVMGGFLVSVYKLGFSPIEYVNRTFNYLEAEDVVSGLVKAAVFGFIVALMGCYQGYHSKGGAQGVGAATTKAVVTASILILTANYVVTELFFSR